MLEKPSGPQQIAEEGEDEINHEGPYLLICSVVVLGLSYSIWHPLHPVFPVRSGELRCAFLWPCIGLRQNPGYTLDFRNEIALAIFVCGSQVLKTSSFSTSPAQHCLRQTCRGRRSSATVYWKAWCCETKTQKAENSVCGSVLRRVRRACALGDCEAHRETCGGCEMRREGTCQVAEDGGEVIKSRLLPPLSGGLCLSGASLLLGMTST